MDLSVVIPLKDEADAVGGLVDEVARVLESCGMEFEIICVDDGSTDNTLVRLQALRSGMPPLRIVQHDANCGQSAGLLSGVLHARADRIVTLDGDGQNDPSDIPRLLDAADRHGAGEAPFLVIGHRVNRRDTWSRRLASRIANGVRSRMLGDVTPDSGCGLKLFPRKTFLALPYFDSMHRFLPALVLRQGGWVRSVEVNHRERVAGRSKYDNWGRLQVGLSDLVGVMWLMRRGRIPDATEIENGSPIVLRRERPPSDRG